MRGLGTIANVAAIIIGGLLGLVMKGGLKQHYQDALQKAMGLCTMFIGASGALAGMFTVEGTGLTTGGSMVMIASMVIPFQVLMVPLVSVYGGTLGVLNHRLTLILLHVGFSVSMAMFMFHGAIKTNIPMELEEAATIDGCSRWQTWWKVVFPLLKPTIATVAIINAMAYWNDYLLPSLVLTKKELYTIPIATQAFYGTYSTDIGLVMAALLLAMLPILILSVFLQRYIVEGVTSCAVKG